MIIKIKKLSELFLGDKFDPCNTYIYLRALIQPFTKQIEEELLKKIELAQEFPYVDNKYYDFMPEVSTI